MRLIIKNGLIFDETGQCRNVDIKIDGGVILEIGNGINDDFYPVIDAENNYVLPGFIDLNCDICDPGYESKEDLLSVSRAAARGGFTTITCQPNTDPVVDNKTVVSYIISKSKGQSFVNTLVYGSMTVGCEGKVMAEIGEMAKAGIVALSDGGRCVPDAFLMRNVLSYARMFNIPVITKCDDCSLSDGGVINSGKTATITGLQGIPRESEEVMVARNLILAEHTGGRLHITSVSTKGSVELIRDAKKRGVNVTCETHPHYISLTEDKVMDYNTYAKVMPPLRTPEDVEEVKEGLIDGTIDVISSGHSPCTVESKRMEFDTASFGISSLETTYAISYMALVENGHMSYPDLIERLSKKPAEILGLDSKGAIREGFDADIVIIDRDAAYDINPENFVSKAKFSPFEGESVKGRILYTIAGGEVVYLS